MPVHRTTPAERICCDKQWKSITELNRHVRNKHLKGKEREDALIRCSFPGCSRAMMEPCNMVNHERLHTTEVLRCSVGGCSYRAKDSGAMSRHRGTHKLSKPQKNPYRSRARVSSRGSSETPSLSSNSSFPQSLSDTPALSEAYLSSFEFAPTPPSMSLPATGYSSMNYELQVPYTTDASRINPPSAPMNTSSTYDRDDRFRLANNSRNPPLLGDNDPGLRWDLFSTHFQEQPANANLSSRRPTPHAAHVVPNMQFLQVPSRPDINPHLTAAGRYPVAGPAPVSHSMGIPVQGVSNIYRNNDNSFLAHDFATLAMHEPVNPIDPLFDHLHLTAAQADRAGAHVDAPALTMDGFWSCLDFSQCSPEC